MTFGLVLGGGGVVGIAWELGVLEALAQAGALEPSSATTLIGTSAGSVVSTQIACGRSLDDLVAAQLAPAAAVGGGAAAPDMNAVMQIFGGLMTATEMTTDLAKTIGKQAVEAPTGSEDAWVGSFDSFMGVDGWPTDADLRVVAMSTSKGERRVWTKADGVPVQRAVASSCAVPGLFPPVTIDGDRYTDGGAWSASNADLLAGEGLDAVLFIGPIGGFLAGPKPQVEVELEQVAAKGARTGSLLPGPSFESLRMSLMDPAFRAQGVEAGRADGAAAAARVREVLNG